MNKVLKNSWALFLGMGCIMMAYGFQGSLLGVRAVQEEFSLTATGFMMSGYFVGYFIGAATIPNIISRVGHISISCYFDSLYNDQSIYLVFSKSFNRSQYGLYLHCGRELVKR